MSGTSEPGPPGVAELVPCGFAVVDPAGVVRDANAELLRVAGRDRAEVVGARVHDLLGVGGRIFLDTHLLPQLAMGQSVREVALDVRRPDGTRVPVLVNAVPDVLPDGRVTQVRLAVFESSQRHRFEEDLLAATRAAEQARDEAAQMAQTLQQSLIPPTPPDIDGLAVAAAYRPAGSGREVGGDFYDVFELASGAWLVVLGDVSGKGVEAAAVTSFVRYTVRALAMRDDDPAELLAHLDHALLGYPTGHYCTVVVLRLDRTARGWAARLSLAGHPPPLLRDSTGAVREVGRPGSLLGLLPDAEFVTTRFHLDDETLLMFTDGVTEARSGGRGELFGDDRLVQLLAGTGPEPSQVTAEVVDAVLGFQDGTASDDIAVLALRPRP